MKRLSNKIMDIERRSVTEDHMYNLGHDDAKFEACNIAMKHDEALISAAHSLDLARVVIKISLDKGMITGRNRGPAESVLADIDRSLIEVRELDEHQKTEGVE